ncbi:class I tRNA ligase family protein, partial [Patescibacteria group bacterium]|nr:class I tRNA ligase family protein [Patescibacteria group bacterium]
LERNQRPADNPRGNFVFYEGPPTANGKPGIHHILARSFKDAIVRYRTMRGYRVDRKAGWDTHGLPVELEVEKQLGFTKKQQIEEYGVAAFNRQCRESVWKYLDLWQDITRRIGFWVDLDDPYITYQNDYIESLWWILKEVHGKELDGQPMLYEGHRVTPHCPRCDTSLSSHELAQGYKDVEDPSVYVKLRLMTDPEQSFLVWTTTPWTLPANVAIAVGNDITYTTVKLGSGEKLILAKDRLEVLDEEYIIESEVKGVELIGRQYEPLYRLVVDDEKAYRVYAANFVSTAEGTGIVHIAPAYGEDDALLGNEHGLPVAHSVNQTATVTADVPGQGKFFKEADDDIKADLHDRQLLYKEGLYTHSYPFCWRCSTPLLYFAKKSWYIRMSKLREELLANNEQINWVPEHIKQGRFGEWLREVKDWALSRERYWGTPLPVWKCTQCAKQRVIGGVEEFDACTSPRNTFFFQRHGESTHNQTSTLTSQDLSDKYQLTEKGLKQVEIDARRYKEIGLDAIYASDLYRTKQTAEIIAKTCGLTVVYDERLREVNVGELVDQSEASYFALFSNADERLNKRPAGGGESMRDVRLRMVAALKDINSKHAGQKVLIVSHGDSMYALKTGLLGYSDEQTAERYHEEYIEVGDSWEFELPRRPYDEEGRLDLHRPFVDEIKLVCKCGGEMVREPDVLDCWFDSGAMPLAQWHYPFENRDRLDAPGDGYGSNYPAEYISEAIDQTRGWFYTLLAVSTLLGRGTSYKNVICLGHILDSKGQKMSKSKGNIVDPWEMMDKWGADAIRYYMFTINQPGEPKRFDEAGLEEVTKKVFLILWNVLSFYKMFSGDAVMVKKEPNQVKHELDRWLLSELNALTRDMTEDLESYQVVNAGRRISSFITDLSTWYVRRSRERFKAGDVEVVATLGQTLLTLAKLLAPFTPFVAEELYHEIGGEQESVHLVAWPEAGEADEALRKKMDMVRRAASAGLERRAEAGIPVRQALAKATVSTAFDSENWMSELLQEELNVIDVVWIKGDLIEVELDTEITPDLRRRGLARELVRNINALRKEAGLTPADHVMLNWESDGALWRETITEHGEALKQSVHADELKEGRIEADFYKELEADGQKIWLGFSK